MRAAASLAIWHLTLSAQFCGPRAISLICFKSGLESVIATGKHLYAWCCSCFCCRILSYWKGEEVSEALAFSFTEKIVCCASFMIWLRTTSSYWRCISICIIHRSFWLIASLFLFRFYGYCRFNSCFDIVLYKEAITRYCVLISPSFQFRLIQPTDLQNPPNTVIK